MVLLLLTIALTAVFHFLLQRFGMNALEKISAFEVYTNAIMSYESQNRIIISVYVTVQIFEHIIVLREYVTFPF